MKEFYQDKRILVTGGTGLIGRQVVSKLCDYGAKVTSVSLDNLQIDGRAAYLQRDLRDFNTCLNLTDRDYVFHIAGIKASPGITKEKPATMSIPALMVNTNILEACRQNKVTKTLFTSSIGAYAEAEILKEEHAFDGEPMDYLPGHVKRMAERQILGYFDEDKGKRFVTVRLPNTYGPGDNFDPSNAMVIPSLMAKIYRGEKVTIFGDGSAKKDFAYSEDIAIGILQAMVYGRKPWPINLGSGKEYSIKELVETLHKITPFEYDFDLSKPTGTAHRFLDITKAKYNIFYDPQTSLKEGLQKTWNWFNEHAEEYKRRWNYFASRS